MEDVDQLSQHDPLDAVDQKRDVEINEKPEPFVCNPKIGEKLCVVNWKRHFDRFDLDDNLVFNKQVESIAESKASVL
jgi:hypothetical protein